MNKRDQFSPPAVGGSSLLVIFAVLCLTVFALLSLSSAQAERRQADAASKAARDYYDADLMALEIFAQLRSGTIVDGVREVDGVYEFEIPISQRQILMVRLKNTGEAWKILQWEAVPVEEEPDEALDVWKGTEGKS